MSTVTDTFVNKRIGRYEIKERVGIGGMARVYKAWDTNLDRTVAVKILHEHLAEDKTFKERFEREAKFIASLNHPNIVQVYDFDMIDESGQMVSYMVMPFIPGTTLKEVLEDDSERGERLSHDRIRDILLDVAAALQYAHKRGMVHRDVKPGNILFNEQDRAVLSDFGIARMVEGANLTQEGATVGTPTYISPEQAAGLPVDARSDLYALGVILYEMLAGEPPFSADTNLSLILKHLNEPVPSVSERLSVNNPNLDALIFKTMAKNADDRFQSAQDFADEVLRVFGGQPLPASQSSPSLAAATATMPGSTTMMMEEAKPPQRGLLRSPVGIGALVLVIVVVGIVLLTSRPTDNPLAETPTQDSDTSGGESSYFVSSFSADDATNAGWPQIDNASVIRQITPEGFYRFQSDLLSTAVTSVYDPNAVYADGTITLEGTLDESSNPNSAFGIVFYYLDERNYNVFAVDGQGRYSIWELRDASWHELRGLENERWTMDEFVNPQGEKNRLSITFIDGHFVGWVNDQEVVDITVDEPASTGNVGIYLATYRTGNATALIDTYQVSGDIPAMTGNS
jgi:serine/threonine protein kinase